MDDAFCSVVVEGTRGCRVLWGSMFASLCASVRALRKYLPNIAESTVGIFETILMVRISFAQACRRVRVSRSG